MKLIKRRKYNFEQTIRKCYESDITMDKYSRNLEDIIKDLQALESFSFYEVYENNNLVGYFGKETVSFVCLTTFFILPEYRKHKKKIWKFIKNNLPRTFFSGLFEMNTRAIEFFKKNGGQVIAEGMWENKPSIIFKFER